MKIKSIDTCKLTLPHPQPKTPAQRPSYNKLVKRAHPINRYPEFPRGQGRIPGQSNKEIWVRIINQARMTRKYNNHVNQLYFSGAAHARLSTPAELRMALAGAAPLGAFGKRTAPGDLPSWLELD